ncbi:hypothetical protein SAMN05192574_105349 [Mucilaginibacter gossypiicola]|uniref:Glycine rich protein n=1 Tax=Mucilaginibacter gossypiicola TaxID=551995 RepID=A0A1H8M1M2_9SPHI|nr:hypothetical protein [Mucilaginibacter gossypiicola]SEO11273.1 hypothetical protein SAMN05192574_105349 [Mucilaginibacter gossypiicola]
MKTLTLAAVLLLAMNNVNAKSNVAKLSLKDGGSGSGSHGFTADLKGGEGTRPFKLTRSYCEGTRGGIKQESGAGSSGGGFHQISLVTNNSGAGSSAGGFHNISENEGGGGASGGGFQQNGHETSDSGGSHVGGGFRVRVQNDGGGGSSGGGFHDADEGGHTGNG